jgi:hypothetical protein
MERKNQKKFLRFFVQSMPLDTYMHKYLTPPFISEPAEEYRSKRRHFLTSHQLADFRHCPAYYARKQAGLIPEWQSDAYAIGSAAHCLILEGREVFDALYIVGGPINPTTGRPYGADTKKFRDWSKAAGRIGLSDDQYALVCNLAYSVSQHARAKELLSQGQAEAVLRLQSVQSQIRVDWWNPDEGVVDLKTCDNLDTFESDARKFQYVHQMAFYVSVIYQATRELTPATLIAVEKRDPYRCGVWEIPADDLRQAGLENFAAIAELAECRRTGVWPTRYEAPRKLYLNPEKPTA